MRHHPPSDLHSKHGQPASVTSSSPQNAPPCTATIYRQRNNVAPPILVPSPLPYHITPSYLSWYQAADNLTVDSGLLSYNTGTHCGNAAYIRIHILHSLFLSGPITSESQATAGWCRVNTAPCLHEPVVQGVYLEPDFYCEDMQLHVKATKPSHLPGTNRLRASLVQIPQCLDYGHASGSSSSILR